jgi:hypothetical protein
MIRSKKVYFPGEKKKYLKKEGKNYKIYLKGSQNVLY